MIALWMLYAALVATLAGAAATAAERALRLAGRPARWAWLAAMAVSFALPLASLLVPARTAVGGMETAAAPSSVAASIPLLERATTALAWLDRPLLAVWIAATLGTLGFLLLSAWTLGRFRRGLPAAEVEGVPVRLSRDAGPAVLGFVRGEIVLPAWALAREERLRRLMLEHEREHLRAGDPRLLLAGLVAVAAAPWSPALWWQFHRLKDALEMDCDARVLRGGVDVRAYAELLIEVGRRARPAPLAVAAFSSPTTRIEKRISAMTFRPSNRARAAAALSATVAAGLLLLACETPHPEAPDVPTPARAPSGTAEVQPASASLPRHPAPEGAATATGTGESYERHPAPEGMVIEEPANAASLPRKRRVAGEEVSVVPGTATGTYVVRGQVAPGAAAAVAGQGGTGVARARMTVPGQAAVSGTAATGARTVRPAVAGEGAVSVEGQAVTGVIATGAAARGRAATVTGVMATGEGAGAAATEVVRVRGVVAGSGQAAPTLVRAVPARGTAAGEGATAVTVEGQAAKAAPEVVTVEPAPAAEARSRPRSSRP